MSDYDQRNRDFSKGMTDVQFAYIEAERRVVELEDENAKLREFAEKVIDSQIPSVHPTYEEAITEYAAKLRLADDGEEQ